MPVPFYTQHTPFPATVTALTLGVVTAHAMTSLARVQVVLLVPAATLSTGVARLATGMAKVL